MDANFILDKPQRHFHVALRRVNRGAKAFIGSTTIREELERTDATTGEGFTSEQMFCDMIRKGEHTLRYLKVTNRFLVFALFLVCCCSC